MIRSAASVLGHRISGHTRVQTEVRHCDGPAAPTRVALEQVTQQVGVRGPLRADNSHCLEAREMAFRPLAQQLTHLYSHSSGEAQGLVTNDSNWPSAVAAASLAAGSPHAIRSRRLASGVRVCVWTGKSIPLIPVIHRPAINRATSAPPRWL